MSNKVCALILSGGKGSRMDSDVTKQQMTLCGKSVMYHTLKAFVDTPCVSDIVVVCRDGEENFVNSEISSFDREITVVRGGNTRAESAKHGFAVARQRGADYVAVHDCARCLVTPDIIDKVLRDAVAYGGATASSRVTDSVKETGEDDFIQRSIARESLRLIQTPQIFRADLYERALSACDVNDPAITDDNSMLERIGVRVFCTETGKENIKLTFKEDLAYAEFILKGRM